MSLLGWMWMVGRDKQKVHSVILRCKDIRMYLICSSFFIKSFSFIIPVWPIFQACG